MSGRLLLLQTRGFRFVSMEGLNLRDYYSSAGAKYVKRCMTNTSKLAYEASDIGHYSSLEHEYWSLHLVQSWEWLEIDSVEAGTSAIMAALSMNVKVLTPSGARSSLKLAVWS